MAVSDVALRCLRCDRDVDPSELHEANPAGLSRPWWFHTCGDSIGVRGVLSAGQTLRQFVQGEVERV